MRGIWLSQNSISSYKAIAFKRYTMFRKLKISIGKNYRCNTWQSRKINYNIMGFYMLYIELTVRKKAKTPKFTMYALSLCTTAPINSLADLQNELYHEIEKKSTFIHRKKRLNEHFRWILTTFLIFPIRFLILKLETNFPLEKRPDFRVDEKLFFEKVAIMFINATYIAFLCNILDTCYGGHPPFRKCTISSMLRFFLGWNMFWTSRAKRCTQFWTQCAMEVWGANYKSTAKWTTPIATAMGASCCAFVSG